MTTLPPRLPIVLPAQGMTSGPSAPAMELGIAGNGAHDGPEESCLREEPMDTAETPAASKRRGGFYFDRERGQYPLEWDDLADFEAWRREEELAHTIEIISSSTYHGGPTSLWLRRRVFVCGRQYPGGKSKYQRKNPERKQNIPSKKTGCHFRLVIKHYPNTPIILGHLERDHDHETGLPNLIHTRISRGTRERIKVMLRQKIDPREIVRT